MSKEKAKGTRYETSVVRYLHEALGDPRAERAAPHGVADVGDIAHIWAHGFEGIAECKCYREVAPSDVARFRAETLAERKRVGADFALLVVSAYRRGVAQSGVHVTIPDLTRICNGIQSVGDLAQLYDEHWVVMTLAEACNLMRGV